VVLFLSADPFVFQRGLYLIAAGTSYGLMALFLSKTLSVATASYLAMMSMMTPVFVLLIDTTWLKESLDAFQFLGGGLIIFSGVLVNKLEI